MGTETTVDYEVIGGVYDMLGNKTLTEHMYRNLVQVGGVTYTPEEVVFAEKIQSTFNYTVPPIETAKNIQPLRGLEGFAGGGSTDVGDVSWAVPTVGMSAATWVPGTPAHSWQAVACGGTEIGTKGMMVAAKSMALMGIDLFTDATLRETAKKEFMGARGDNFKYMPLLGDRKPALNYRDME
jgi:aminobenzoyl-glutamate utilization protein B